MLILGIETATHQVGAAIGGHEGVLSAALDRVKYKELRAEQARRRKEKKYIGIGVTTYVEICGLGPSQVAGAVGFQGGLWESAIVRVHPTGKVHVYIGASPHGQGEETTFARISPASVTSAAAVSSQDVSRPRIILPRPARSLPSGREWDRAT